MLDPRLSRLAVCSVVVLIAVLSYPAQLYLFRRFWSAAQFYAFNTLVACVWISYFRTMLTDPGSPPRNWVPPVVGADDAEDARGRHENRRLVATGGRWCKRCQRFKPARTHHCRTCKRCILRMDHHCPWTNCCIGYRNTPHFLRFLFYTTIATSYLLLHLLSRAYAVWITRHRPAYYSPHTFPQLLLLASLLLISAPLSLTLLVLFLRTAVQAATGYTTIETWELDHHRALVRRGVTRNQVP
ncbi:DHHC palmitoyltransferase-domain-containing protein, partial [Sphaerosporella brunnea]